MALEKNESIVIERASLASAQAAENGAQGAYDFLLNVNADWERSSPPVNSAFSGAPSGAASPTNESTSAGASLSKLLSTGGSVTLSTSTSRQTTDGAFSLLSPAYATQAGVEFRQPLLRNRSTDPARSAIRIAASDRKRAEASLRREVSDTVLAVEQAYWTLVAARHGVEVQDEAVRLAAEQLEETRQRIEKGASPETEISQPRAELERRRGESFAAREAASRAETALKLLILGDDDETAWSEGYSPVDEAETSIQPVDVATAMDHALASRPELDEAEATLERRRTEAALARDAVHPALDAVASYDRFGFTGDRNPAGIDLTGMSANIPDGFTGSWGSSAKMLGKNRYDDARVGLQFSLPLGNRAARAGEAIARSDVRQAGADLSRARKQVRAEILDAAAALETAAQRIEAARTAREAAEVQLSAERDRFGAGLSTNFLVLTRQNELSRARLDEIAALTDYRVARAQMARAEGSLLQERGIEIDTAGAAGGSGGSS